MKGLDLTLYWIGFAFGASLIWQIAFEKSSIDMLKEAIAILLFAGIWEFSIGNWYRSKKAMQQEQRD